MKSDKSPVPNYPRWILTLKQQKAGQKQSPGVGVTALYKDCIKYILEGLLIRTVGNYRKHRTGKATR